MQLKLITSVAPYATAGNAMQAVEMAHQDGFSGVELDEDHLRSLVRLRPSSLRLIREYSADKHMINSLHKTLFRPSIDSLNEAERKKAVDYTLKTIDCMEAAGVSRMVMHSFSDLPSFFRLKGERANKALFMVGCNVVKIYGVLAPPLKAYRQARRERIEASFMRSLAEIAGYAADKKIGGMPIEIVFEEHYSDAIDYGRISYGKGNLGNVIRGIDTAHRLIRTGSNTDLSGVSGPIHFHAVDTNGFIDDHRAVGTGKVDFRNALSQVAERRLTETLVMENSTRKSALRSKEALASMIRRLSVIGP